MIKVNGDAEENYLFPAHLLDKLQDVDIKQVYKCKFRRTHFLQIQWESLNRSTYWRDVYQLTFFITIQNIGFSHAANTHAQVPSLPPLESSLLVRPLRLSDFDTGFLALLAQLTSVGEITR